MNTPQQVQKFLNHWNAHCMETALVAAVILECHGYPPLVMSLESADQLDHVLFIYRWRQY
jgi:hypothetical protein